MAACQSIPDKFNNIYEVKNALNNAGLESANLIIGIDFTKSNEWTGRCSFDGKSLHQTCGPVQNPYQHVISVLGSTLLGYDDDKKIPCFGFGDASTHDQRVFSFYHHERPCDGVEGVLRRYKELLPHITLSGPTSFAPLIHAAIDIVKNSGNQFHILLIVADGQVTGTSAFQRGILTQQERETIDAIVTASNYPLSIIMVGVGDGPWNTMEAFDDAIPVRKFDNFQFVNYTEIMAEYRDATSRDIALAVEALMELPEQYEQIKNMNWIRESPFSIRNSVNVIPPPIPVTQEYQSSKPSPQVCYGNIQPPPNHFKARRHHRMVANS
ncbi:hypothetical protein KP509_06G023900 [Ceratopteris richardii]|uniref:Copine C-terminal domain-containing protein n=1 Tax=Ceratopteris richardii TaxID=49495 RepID=A0A8T2UL31_CERRI|nr:hypothetical protein KP509_06G023900 [Ceratopteris richardii]KAH7434577.1 hypothetical protein KP509_06G023900 [Ceratopteris richardii]